MNYMDDYQDNLTNTSHPYFYLGSLLRGPCNSQVLNIAEQFISNKSPEVRLASLTLISKFPKSQEVEELVAKFTDDSVESIREVAFYILRKWK